MNGWENIVINDGVEPSQWADMQRSGQATPEKRLMMGLLTEVRHHIEYKGNSAGRRRAQVEAQRWLEDNDTRYPFSFLNICEAMGILDIAGFRRRWLDPTWRLKRRSGVTRAGKVTMRRYQRVRA